MERMKSLKRRADLDTDNEVLERRNSLVAVTVRAMEGRNLPL